MAFGSICDQAACPRLVRLPINSEHYTRLSRLRRRGLFLLLGRRACRRDHGNAEKCCNSNTERNHDRSSPLARQPQRASTESFAFASLIVIATLRSRVTGERTFSMERSRTGKHRPFNSIYLLWARLLGRKHVSVCDAMLSSPLTENWRRITSLVRPSCRQSSPCPLPRRLATIRCGRCRARQDSS